MPLAFCCMFVCVFVLIFGHFGYRLWCCSALWPVLVRTPRSKWLRNMKSISSWFTQQAFERESVCVCLPLQAVRGAAAGFQLHFGPGAGWSEGQAAGQSLQNPGWASEGPAEGEPGTHDASAQRWTLLASVFARFVTVVLLFSSWCACTTMWKTRPRRASQIYLQKCYFTTGQWHIYIY